MGFIGKLYRILLQILCVPIFLSDFFKKETGAEYGVGFWTKLGLVFKMIRNNNKIVSGSTFMEHIIMATSLLRVPKDLTGVVVECGTYKGVSATNLSLICRLVNRRLEIFDSFEGLPEPNAEDKAHVVMDTKEIHSYEKGSWCGTLDEVRSNIARYGDINVCNFRKGYFNQTLPHFTEKCVQVFVDADYRSSVEDCLRNLWPLLQDGCYFYSHEVGHMEISSLYFSEEWWKKNLHINPPGLVGAGTGVGIKILSGPYFSSSLGYTIKNPEKAKFVDVPQLGGMKLTLTAPIKLTGKPHKKD